MDRALVSPIPGTTRDTVEESIILAGFPIRLIDTAGLRTSKDPVELEGIARTRTAMQDADLVLALIDSTQPDDPCSKEWEPISTKVLAILTKSDLPSKQSHKGLLISAKTGKGLDTLQSQITLRLTADLGAPGSDEIAITSRHEDALRKTTEALACASASLIAKSAPELVASDLRTCPSLPGIYSRCWYIGRCTRPPFLSVLYRQMNLYSSLARPLLFQLSPEVAHHLTLACTQNPSHLATSLPRQKSPFRPNRTLMGLPFRNRLGIAAGLDKNAEAPLAWRNLGFGFAELGTITFHPQPGNPKPRVFRYPHQQALINRLGFPNLGADAIATRLRKLRGKHSLHDFPIGINLGKSKVTPLDQAPLDYLASLKLPSTSWRFFCHQHQLPQYARTARLGPAERSSEAPLHPSGVQPLLPSKKATSFKNIPRISKSHPSPNS